MAINFPNNPSNSDTFDAAGVTFVYNSTKGTWTPQNPSENSSSVTVYATVDNLPNDASAGDQAFVTATNRLYISNGSGWYNIALINTTPSISGVSSSYALAIDGTPTTVTITATDPEGLPITYSIANDTSGNIATVTSNNNVFTITPSTNTADAGTFSLTFRASDGVNIATAVSSFTLQFKVENSNYTTALITSVGDNNAVNNSFVDSSTNSHTITAVGNATQTTFSPYRHGGYSTRFVGAEYLKTNSSISLANDFTMEFWVYRVASGNDYMVCVGNTNSTSGMEVYIGASGGQFNFYHNGAWRIYSTSSIPALNEWSHIAVVRDSGTVTMYLNGTSLGTYNMTDTISGEVYVNAELYNSSVASGGDGYMRDVRIVDGTAIYTSNFTPPTEKLTEVSGTEVLLCNLPYIADSSSNGLALTITGTPETQPFSPYDSQEYTAASHGGSMYFDGTGDYLTIADDASFTIGSGDFTAECWVYPTASPNQPLIFGQWSNPYSWAIQLSNDGNRYARMIFHDGNYQDTVTSTPVALNAWTHLAIVKSGSTATLYVNGVSVGTDTVGTLTDASSALTLGALSSGGQTFQGSIANARLVVGTAVYTSNFTPPTAPLTAITNTSLLVQGTNAGIIDKSQSSSQLILDGDTKCSSTQTKYRSTAIYTDGTGDRIRFQVENSKIATSWGVGGRPFTVEWWQYDEMPYTTNHIIGPNTGGGVGGWNSTNGHEWLTFFSSSTFYVQYFGTNGNYNTITGTASTMGFVQNQWQHIAHTYDGTTWRFYIDGTEALSSNLPNVPQAVNVSFATLGAMPDNAYHSATYYDDVRITKGLARYTSNFTPPTAALQG